MGTPIRYTTKFSGRLGGTWRTANAVYARLGGTWRHCRYVYVKLNGSWVGVYSTPDVTISGGGSAGMSGASSSGQAYVYAIANLGGTHSGSISYSWANIGGNAIQCSNAGIANPYFYYDFVGVPNGTTSGPVSATFRCTITDTLTGAQSYADVTIGNLTWQNTIPAFSGHTDKITSLGGGSVNRPTGANSVTIYAIAYGGQGGGGFNGGGEPSYGGGGGGGGGRMVWSGAASSSYSYMVGNLGQPTSVSGIGTANAGSNGDSASPGGGGGGGLGGSASGGNVANDTGGAGDSSSGDTGGSGGSGQSAPDGTYGQGSDGGNGFGGGGGNYGPSVIFFVWSP
jgi:hypothetical protein